MIRAINAEMQMFGTKYGTQIFLKKIPGFADSIHHPFLDMVSFLA
jgi:hypothetical protein